MQDRNQILLSLKRAERQKRESSAEWKELMTQAVEANIPGRDVELAAGVSQSVFATFKSRLKNKKAIAA